MQPVNTVLIDTAQQLLQIKCNGKMLKHYLVSTAVNGVGQLQDSGQTPLGKHIIRAKIGSKEPLYSVFVGRRPTGEIANPYLIAQQPERDWILTRILWLSGSEVGLNRLGHVDSMRRFIYIHGTNDTAQLGKPVSHGCIRMDNFDVIELFEMVEVGAEVIIQ